MSEKTLLNASPDGLTLSITRNFDAPRELVFKVWTTPEHLVKWWVCPMTICEIDLRVGGSYRYVIDDGALIGTYSEVVPPDRLVYTQIFDKEPWSEQVTHVTETFFETNGKTTVTSTMVFPSAASRDAAIGMGMTEGISASMDLLDNYLIELR